jgi:cytosine/adenosine deaminase-related metal-dependent hydrolase
MRDDIGRLAPDAKADIVIVDMDKVHIGPVAADDPIKALVYCATGDDVETVVIDGIKRVEDGEVLGLDRADLRERAVTFDERLRANVAKAVYQGRPLTEFYESAFPDWRAS